ncbi:hypothetical protein IDM40_14325 [Nocardiopsis sp. HNM0947]|uniref:4-amino-4-deoxy-L-arabinose transferase n=1 Tax=Nocardiopsis coralli TaxID=2772213 RepID=A0ABR9P7Q1_9ACTN|nr:hypothetical protein [Nocardiopsis coralli]MBE2999873.1 hypothetical protein [Nocardiopsis coralli]
MRGAWTARLLPWAVGLVAGVLALGPALGRGFVLRYDMVFVPDLSVRGVLADADGFPRAIPSDAVVGALSSVLPGDLVQSLALLAVFVLGGAGAARLALRLLSSADGPTAGTAVASVAAGVAYVWNPFVAERLLLGQWAVLLGYAGLPWVVAATARLAERSPGRGLAGLVCALIPAAVGGFSSVLLSALAAGPVALWRRGPRALRWWARAGLFAAALVLVSLPWLVPSLTAGAVTDPRGVEAFAPRADTPFGVLGSLLALGGVWNAGAVPPGYGEPVTALLRLVLCVLALATWVWWMLRRDRPVFGTGLSVGAAVGFTIALAGATGAGRAVTSGLIELWPGFGPLRDAQLYVAPLGLVQALGLAFVVWWAAGAAQAPVWRVGTGVFAALLPVVVLPGLVWGAGGRLEPVEYPDEWVRAQNEVAADDVPGSVVVLPWSAYRGLDWSGETTVALDPATKLFDRRTVWNDDLSVGTPDGGTVVVEGEDPLAVQVAGVLDPDPETGMPRGEDLAAELGALGARYVVVSAPVDNGFWSEGQGFEVVSEGSEMTLFRVPEARVKADKPGITGLEVTGGLVTVGAIIWSVGRSGSSLVLQCPGPRAGRSTRKEIPT